MLGQKSVVVVVYVDRNRLQFSGGGLSSILALDIPPTTSKDLEIINRDALYTLINQWLKQNNLGNSDLVFILSPQTYFDKVIAATGESEQETEILAFYDNIPFEDLATRLYTIENKRVAVATNKDFVEAIKHAFTLQGHQVVSVIPALTLGSLAAKRWLDAEMSSYVLKHFDTLRSQTILEEEEVGQNVPRPSTPPQAKSNSRLLIMVGAFGLLLLVLIFMLFTRH